MLLCHSDKCTVPNPEYSSQEPHYQFLLKFVEIDLQGDNSLS